MNRSFFFTQSGLSTRLPFIILGVIALYFGYHLMTGERSIIAYVQLDQQLEIAQAQFDEVSAQRIALEDKVKRLRPSSLDLDFLEERAHVMLGYGHDNDLFITQ